MKTTTRKRVLTFQNKIDKRRIDVEELTIKTQQVAELNILLCNTIEDEHAIFSDGQKKIPIFNEEERDIIKKKMFYLIEKYFN